MYLKKTRYQLMRTIEICASFQDVMMKIMRNYSKEYGELLFKLREICSKILVVRDYYSQGYLINLYYTSRYWS